MEPSSLGISVSEKPGGSESHKSKNPRAILATIQPPMPASDYQAAQPILGNCALCGNFSELTQEHIYADWISKIAPGWHVRTANTLTIGRTETVQEVAVQSGQSRIPVLCQGCNNQWGSKLQNRAKKIVKPLICGQWPSLTKHDREELTRWLSCLVMVREFIHPELMVFRANDRKEFRESSRPPSNLAVWVAPFTSTDHDFATWLRCFATDTLQTPIQPDLLLATVVVPQTIFVYVWSRSAVFNELTSPVRASVERYLDRRGFVRVWPTIANWPAQMPPALSTEDFESIADGFTGAIVSTFPTFIAERDGDSWVQHPDFRPTWASV